MKTEVLIILLVAAAAAGIGAAVVASTRGARTMKKRPFQELLEQGISVECLTGARCSTWFREQNAHFHEPHVGIMLYATREFISLLGFACPSDADLRNYILQLVVRKENSDILAFRLINFAEIEPSLEARLQEAGKLVVEL